MTSDFVSKLNNMPTNYLF